MSILEWYRQAANVIGTLINQHKFPLNRTIALNRHRWYAMLDPYDALEAHFRMHKDLTTTELAWLQERALSRNEFIIFSDYTPKELFIHDVLDMLDYYNYKWEWNPPKGYVVPETFYL